MLDKPTVADALEMLARNAASCLPDQERYEIASKLGALIQSLATLTPDPVQSDLQRQFKVMAAHRAQRGLSPLSYSEWLADGGESRLSDPVQSDGEIGLRLAAREVLEQMMGSYRAKNNRQVTIEDDDGEACWIVPDCAVHNLREALTRLTSLSAPVEKD